MQLTGLSRSDSHEIVRHRHFSFSQQSQRYVLVEPPYEIVIPPAILGEKEEDWLRDMAVDAFDTAKMMTESLRKQGVPRKQAAEAARAILPNCAATHMVITGNIRSWMEFISKRDHPAADASIQRVAAEINKILEAEFPEIFDEESRSLWDEQFAQEGVKNND
jgi:thymidylate synthase (FAD)